MASSHRSENEEELASPLVVNINLNQTQVNSNASPVNVMKLRGSSFKRKTYCGMSENAGDIPSLKNMMTRNFQILEFCHPVLYRPTFKIADSLPSPAGAGPSPACLAQAGIFGFLSRKGKTGNTQFLR